MRHEIANVAVIEQPFDERTASAVASKPGSMMGPRIMFMYWGRRGSSRFARDLMAATPGSPCAEATLCVSRQNDELASFAHLGARLSLVDTFTANHGAITGAWRIPLLRCEVAARVKRECTDAVIDLMPHVWSPFVIPAIRRAGARYICVLHDAVGHPGDRSGVATQLLRSAAYRADHVLALSRAVGDSFLAMRRLRPDRLTVLFHPHLGFGGSQHQRRPPAPGTPLRL